MASASQSQHSDSLEETQGSTTDQPPLWDNVTKLEKLAGGAGGSWKFKCNFCNESRQGSYSRVRAHLLGIKGFGISICKKTTAADKANMKRLEDAYEQKKLESQAKEVEFPCEAGVGSKKRKGISTPIERAFGVEIRDQLDQEIARMFYTGGLPFNLARNPHYFRAFQFAANNKIDGYVPPGYNKLRTTLLQKEKDNVHRLLQPLKSTWKEKGVTIVSDGWSDPTRKPLINFMATSGNGPLFLKAVNCFGEIFIADLMKEVINEVGHQNVVQIITNNATNCKAAGEIIESQFPHIYWTPYVVHTLNLALKNICSPRNVETNQLAYEQCSWIKEVHEEALAIKNFIMNHNMRLSIFTKFTPLRMLSVANTRFASIIVMLKRLKLIKRGLQAMVISDEWSSYRLDDTVQANLVKDYILNDEWWDKVAYILSFTEPIYEMIRVCDTDKPCLHLVYEMWDAMIEKVKIEIYKKEKRPMSQISCFCDVVHHPTRCAPHRDGEISQERMKCFRRLFPSDDEYSKVLDEYAMFSMKTGPFDDLTCISKMGTMEPKNWWVNFGAQAPLLQTSAFRLLGQPTSFLVLSEEQVDSKSCLVYIHNNLRLLSRNLNPDAKMWDVGGDAFDSMEDVGFLEVADLSLDEPDFENDLIIDKTIEMTEDGKMGRWEDGLGCGDGWR
ncbi:hypothetical protein OSB04_006179 [Centaurea solstitialis]|uniref:DUF659 domain-containing protein n=1 Tax=Centaurea solstitialis TaxID=347529 RepID=A0AA38WRV7_9ASTR|nr:hypothetical protein OSB04_006179 [Centaurea solstitialis]